MDSGDGDGEAEGVPLKQWSAVSTSGLPLLPAAATKAPEQVASARRSRESGAKMATAPREALASSEGKQEASGGGAGGGVACRLAATAVPSFLPAPPSPQLLLLWPVDGRSLRRS